MEIEVQLINFIQISLYICKELILLKIEKLNF